MLNANRLARDAYLSEIVALVSSAAGLRLLCMCTVINSVALVAVLALTNHQKSSAWSQVRQAPIALE